VLSLESDLAKISSKDRGREKNIQCLITVFNALQLDVFKEIYNGKTSKCDRSKCCLRAIDDKILSYSVTFNIYHAIFAFVTAVPHIQLSVKISC